MERRKEARGGRMTGKHRILQGAGAIALALILCGCGGNPPADDIRTSTAQPHPLKQDISASTSKPAKGQDAKVLSEQQQAVQLENSDGGKSPQ
jgi:hypothetical protein